MDGVAYLFVFLGNTDVLNLLVIFELHHFFPPENITKCLYHLMIHFDEELLVIQVFGSSPKLFDILRVGRHCLHSFLYLY